MKPCLLLFACLAVLQPASADTLKILLPATQAISGFPSQGFMASMRERFDEIIYGRLDAADAVTGADAYLVSLIAGGAASAPYYSEAELASLSQLLKSDRPSVIPFEWLAWRNSSQQIAGLVGGTYSSLNITSLPIGPHPILSAGIEGRQIQLGSPGLITWEGRSVIGDVVTLAGPNENVVLLGDVSIVDQALTTKDPNNARFRDNLADFLGGPPIDPVHSAKALIGHLATIQSVSDDGEVLAGNFVNQGRASAFRYSADDGFQVLPADLPPITEGVWTAGMSADGEVVFGHLQYDAPGGTVLEGFVWQKGSGFHRTGLLPGSRYSVCRAVSPDGRTIGVQTILEGKVVCATWSLERGLERFDARFPEFPEAANSPVHLSNDARTVWMDASLNGSKVIHWTDGEEPVIYSDLPSDFSSLSVRAVTPDGELAFGQSHAPTGFRAVRMLPGGELELLLPDELGQSAAADVTPDGRIIIGNYSETANPRIFTTTDSFVLDRITGEHRLLSQILAEHVPEMSGWTGVYAVGISADGDTLVGSGIDPLGRRDSWVLRGVRKFLVANLPPVILPTLPRSVSANAAADPMSLPLGSYVEDPDAGDPLAWAIVSVSRPEIFRTLEIGRDSGELTVKYNPWQWGESEVVVSVTDSAENVVEITLTFTLPQPPRPGLLVANKSPTLRRQTGLYEQSVSVIHSGSRQIAGFDLLITGLPDGVSVHNASGRDGDTWIVEHRLPMDPGATVALVLEYHAPIRGIAISPRLEVRLVTEPEAHAAAGNPGLAIDRCERLTEGLLIEFLTIPGELYEIQYSGDGAEWRVSPARVRAAGNRTQWIDRGPPNTDSPPADHSSRFYRVRQVSESGIE